MASWRSTRIPLIKGFTTNPTLMRKAGIDGLRSLRAASSSTAIPDRPISFEVFADDFDEMIAQGRVIASWGEQRQRQDSGDDHQGRVHRPGDPHARQCRRDRQRHRDHDRAAGRSASPNAWRRTCRRSFRCSPAASPTPAAIRCRSCAPALRALAGRPKAELLWASPRELLNIFQADEIGCHIITVSHDVLAKLSLVGKDLDEYSLETVKMFHKRRHRGRLHDRDAGAPGGVLEAGVRATTDRQREMGKCRTDFRVYS